MPFIFPLTLPPAPAIKTFRMIVSRVSGGVESPFTRQEQIQSFPGRLMEADITMPPMRRAEAESWLTFMMKLDGRAGTFLLGDPDATAPRGSVAGGPQVKGASQTGLTLITDGWTPGAIDVLLAGDYIQLGSGTITRLYKALTDVSADGTGAATIDIWPSLRESPADNEVLVTSNARGTFRLAASDFQWTTDDLSVYGITFGAREAI